jgi:hypothetical protein
LLLRAAPRDLGRERGIDGVTGRRLAAVVKAARRSRPSN